MVSALGHHLLHINILDRSAHWAKLKSPAYHRVERYLGGQVSGLSASTVREGPACTIYRVSDLLLIFSSSLVVSQSCLNNVRMMIKLRS